MAQAIRITMLKINNVGRFHDASIGLYVSLAHASNFLILSISFLQLTTKLSGAAFPRPLERLVMCLFHFDNRLM